MDELAESIAAHLEILELIIRGAGGREQDDGLRSGTRGRIAMGGCEGLVQRDAALVDDLAVEGGGELFARGTDQVSLGDPRK